MRIQPPILLLFLAALAAARHPAARHLQKGGKSGGSLVGELGTCDSQLLRSFNLFGRSVARATSLNVCPNVYLSCCTEADQVAIYDNWETDNEEESLNQRFTQYTNSINAFFEKAEEATEAASRVLTYMERMKNNECKLMARRVVSYQVGDLRKTLLRTFKDTYDYMVKAHEGLYCSLCDANSHVFFNSGQKKVQVSEEFCRSFIANTLTTLVYLRVHIPKFINLLNTFMGTCDSKGRYLKRTLPQGVVQTVDVTTEKILTSCFKGRNTATWLTNCQSICQKWTPGKISPYFAPDSAQLDAAAKHIMDSMDKFAEEDQARLLAETGHKKTKKLAKGKKERRLQKGPPAQQVTAATTTTTTSTKTAAPSTSAPASGSNSTAKSGSGSASTSSKSGSKTIDEGQFDQYGNPLNYTNFTRNGTDVKMLQYLHTRESNVTNDRSGLPVNLKSKVVYQSQNTTVAPTFSDWVVEVNTKGADFYLASQYSRIDLDAIEGLYQPTDEMPKMKKAKKERRLGGAGILTPLVAGVVALLAQVVA